jgi:hypothetical protein
LAYAPDVLASFGTGPARIDVRAIAQHGAAAYKSTLKADLAGRKESGAELLHTDRIVVAPAARAALSAGEVDPRLLVTIVGLAAAHPIEVIMFTDAAPGANPDVSPLRSAELTQPPGAPATSSSAFVKSTLGFLSEQGASPQESSFDVYSTQRVPLPLGGQALRVEFPAPSPLGLLNGAGG